MGFIIRHNLSVRRVYQRGDLEYDLRRSLRRTCIYLALIVLLHTLVMVALEGMVFVDALWLTLTTMTTVGYGDLAAATWPGRLATVLLIYCGGIYVLAKAAGDYFEYRFDVHSRKIHGEWRWNMSDHIVILNTPYDNGEQFLVRLTQGFREAEQFHRVPIQILTRAFIHGLPPLLRRVEDLTHYHGRADDEADLMAVNVPGARIVVILAKQDQDPGSDGQIFDIVHRVRELSVHGTILAEVVDDNNRGRLQRAGADIIIRPIRAYPGLIVRALVAPGSELIIENLFTSAGDEYRRIDIDVRGLIWREIVCALIRLDLGISVAYVRMEDGALQCNPPATEVVQACALILMVRDDNIPHQDTVRAALASIA